MRFKEILGEFASNLPPKYDIDPETDLAMNLPKQWSQSPYLGAVKTSSRSGYIAQIHMPQVVWLDLVDNQRGQWNNAPDSFFRDSSKDRPSMIMPGFADPRQAAWFAQEVLYGGDTKAYMEDYFDKMYNGGDGQLCKNLRSQVPHFEGAPLSASDEEAFFAERDPKVMAQKKNADNYAPAMTKKVKTALVDFYSRNPALAKKRLGPKVYSKNLEATVDQLIADKGIEFFMTGPGSVKMKDIASLTF